MKCAACGFAEGGALTDNGKGKIVIDKSRFIIVGNSHITDRHPKLYACPKCGTVRIELA